MYKEVRDKKSVKSRSVCVQYQSFFSINIYKLSLTYQPVIIVILTESKTYLHGFVKVN